MRTTAFIVEYNEQLFNQPTNQSAKPTNANPPHADKWLLLQPVITSNLKSLFLNDALIH